MLINPPQKALTLAKENGIKGLIKWDLLNPGEERGGREKSQFSYIHVEVCGDEDEGDEGGEQLIAFRQIEDVSLFVVM